MSDDLLTVPPHSVYGYGALAVSPSQLASQAAVAVMGSGGTAADGAIAANAALGVLFPTANGLGGDLFAMVLPPSEQQPSVLNATGRAGSNSLLGVRELQESGAKTLPLRGPMPVTVPGGLDGWLELSRRHGRLSLREILTPAIELAETGFPASSELVSVLENNRVLLQSQPPAQFLYPDGELPRIGDRIRRPDLASTMSAIASSGRDALYAGTVGDAIVEATGGRITLTDLEQPSAEWVEPIGSEILGHTAWTAPPNSQGYLTLAATWLFEQLDPPRDWRDPAFHHLAIEAYRAVAWERDDLITDPSETDIDPDLLCDPARLRDRVGRIQADSLATWPANRESPGGTVFIAVVDQAGMGVSLISSLFAGIGSGLAAGQSGVFLQNRGSGFSLLPGHRNELRPGKRTLHTLSPTIWTKEGKLTMLLGTRGGHTQPQILLQVAALLWAGLSPAEAQAFPRWTLEGFQPGDVPRLTVESRMPTSIVEGLQARGHEVALTVPFAEQVGPVAIVQVREDGLRSGTADPRVADAAAAVS